MKKTLMGTLVALLILGFASMGFAADEPSTDLKEEANTASSELSKPKAAKKHKHRKRAARKSSKKRTKKNSRKKVKEAYHQRSDAR